MMNRIFFYYLPVVKYMASRHALPFRPKNYSKIIITNKEYCDKF